MIAQYFRVPCSISSLIVFILLTLLFIPNSNAEPLTKVKLGIVSYIGDATNYHAFRSGYFEEEGLDVSLVKNSAGVHSLKQVVQGEIDIGAVAPTPVVYLAMGRIKLPPNFRIIASVIQSTNLNHLIILDKTIHPTVASLEGKRLGIQRQTASEYFWYNAALAHNFDPDKVELINIPTPELANAAKNKEIDAAIAWSPFHQDVLNAVDTPSLHISGSHFYTTWWLVVVRPEFLEKQPEAVEAYLRALARSESDLKRDPLSVAAFHTELVESTPEQLIENYNDVVFDLSITESQIINLSEQGKWALSKGYVKGEVPDFRKYFDISALDKVKPLSIRLLE